ncbi:MAG: SMP-30/gluconolactonase/LRE family protein [Acidihalobacter sp.]|uniref:SMP-30/gluconolactonase/LRE family protein n=1 Tax=Acidihalobacter sp. TaxID=1872108 RepID=UPI00307CE36C
MSVEEVECLWDARAELGEGPLWASSLEALLFVDILGARLLQYRPAEGAKREWPLDEACCWLIERGDGDGFIAGLRSRIVHLRLDESGPRVVEELARPEAHLPGNRFNDAKADPAGRVWAGSMDAAERDASGALYRLDDRGMVAVDRPYVIANGPAFSPDGRTLYHTDTAVRTVYALDCSEQGVLSGKRVHIRFDAQDGFPDGMTCDAEGGLWVAHFGGSCLSRFHPDGRFDRRVRIPATQVTSCTFGGAGFDELYVTTAARGRDDEPLAGALFRLRPGVRGLPPNRFGRPDDGRPSP